MMSETESSSSFVFQSERQNLTVNPLCLRLLRFPPVKRRCNYNSDHHVLLWHRHATRPITSRGNRTVNVFQGDVEWVLCHPLWLCCVTQITQFLMFLGMPNIACFFHQSLTLTLLSPDAWLCVRRVWLWSIVPQRSSQRTTLHQNQLGLMHASPGGSSHID